MALTELTQRTTESKLRDFDFSGEMRTGETISAVSGVTTSIYSSASLSPAALTVGSTTFSGQIAQARLSGGTDQTYYKVICRVTTNQSNTLDLEGWLYVADTEASPFAPIVTLEQARFAFNLLCPITTCPELGTPQEVDSILARCRRATRWTATTTYELGAEIIPTLPNRTGSRYRLARYTTTGTDQKSGTVEPSWSDARDGETTDNHVIWQEAGSDWNGVLWDLTAAARDGWTLKMGKASTTADSVIGEMQIRSSQLFEHCKAMRDSFRPAYFL